MNLLELLNEKPENAYMALAVSFGFLVLWLFCGMLIWPDLTLKIKRAIWGKSGEVLRLMAKRLKSGLG